MGSDRSVRVQGGPAGVMPTFTTAEVFGQDGKRPDPPAGHVYLADVLDIVRRHAGQHGWCGEAEEFIREAFGLSEEDLPRNVPSTWCCASCDGPPPADTRFTLADPAKVIRVSRLKDAVRDGIREYADGDDDQYRVMFADVIDAFGLPVEKPAAP